ncbi:FAD-binding oxidoreductase [Aestuariivirga sp.]|uniref:NAD(P)/FAD-dependent oxidoreductase n=1 Tax=Aestuariivirga sp. TaxID=2650926 RepID=UPI0025C217F3|nr:FAD-binding oxidoreductase [Aestuariivirga sp.]MCA3554562.1 FAD-binding oxidoreductase [Aestuariivirga sp.]
MSRDFDIIVIGGGIAGASVAAHLAEDRRVAICEMEERPGYHATGRSAAMYEPNYGPPPMLALTRASGPEFRAGGFLAKRDTIFFAPPEQEAQFRRLMGLQKGMREISVAAAKQRFPHLVDGYAAFAVLDEHTADIDVDALHQHYLKLFRQRGGALHCGHGVTGLEKRGQWTLTARGETLRAPIIVDAAGAWGDAVAEMAGRKPIGLQPMRRSMAVTPGPGGGDFMTWPMVGDVGETWYCKPQSGKLLISPAEATPVDPHDAYADDMALAEGIARFQEAVNCEVTRVERTWGGLRSFAPDGCPVVGYDGKEDGFFWLIGQGGYGIQSSPALSRLAAALVRGDAPPADIMDEGLALAGMSPERFA